MKFGPTIKRIRTEKGLLLKELYAGVVAKDFSIKFEKGQVNLNAVDFIEIINRLSLSVEEFLYIKNEYQLLPDNHLANELSLIINGKLEDKSQGRDFYQKYRKSRTEYQRMLAYVAYSDYLVYFPAAESPEYSKEKALLKTYLLEKDLWTLEEVRLFSTISVLFEEETSVILIKKCLGIYDKYASFKSSNIVELKSTLLENHVLGCYHLGKIANGNRWLPELLSYLEKVTDIYRRSRINLCYSLFLSYTGNRIAGEKRVVIYTDGLEVLNYQELAQTHRQLFAKLAQKEGI